MVRTIVAMLLVLAVDARADTSARAKANATTAYADGQRRYLAEDYEGAAKQFLVAYGLDPDPAYLFNVAQAYRFGKQCARSAKYYRRFLAVVSNPPNKADVAKYIVEQDACAKTQPPPGPDPEPPTQGDPKPDSTPVPVKIEPKRDPDPPRKSDPGQLRKRLALLSFAAGAVGVGAGVAFALRIESLEKETERLCMGDQCPANIRDQEIALENKAATAQKLMITGFAAGGVAIGAGVFLYITGKSRSERVAVTPTPAKKIGRLVRPALLVAPNGAYVSLTFSH